MILLIQVRLQLGIVMFKCDELIYIQMHKTGCTHIASLLSMLFNGEIIGKHNTATSEQLKSTQFFFRQSVILGTGISLFGHLASKVTEP